MKKIKGFIIAVILAALTLYIGDHLITQKISKIPSTYLRNNSEDFKNGSPSILKSAIDINTIPIMGSSELNSDSDKPYNIFKRFQQDNLNLLKIGKGGYQSLVQASILGSIGNDIKSKKVVFFISPQWFDQKGLNSAAAIDKISLTHVNCLLNNPKLSHSTKTAFINRLLSLTKSNRSYHEKVNSLFISYKTKKNLPLSIRFDLLKEYEKNRVNLAKKFFNVKSSSKQISLKKIPLDKMILEADGRAKRASTNNHLGVESKYYDKHIKKKLSSFKNSCPNSVSLNSVEFNDLKLLYTISNELGLEMEAYSIPVHGQWYDYIGTPKKLRQDYYKKIDEITKSYKIKLVDLSNHEYDKHFLRDIMHLGEKGWVIIGEHLEKFARQK